MSQSVSEDRASSCAFVFADGRVCRMLHSHNSEYCLHHERTLRRLREADCTAASVSEPLEAAFVSISSLNASLARLFAAIADGRVPPKTAIQLINLAKVLYKTIPMANREFLLAFNDSKGWNQLIRKMYTSAENPFPFPVENNSVQNTSKPAPAVPNRQQSTPSQVQNSAAEFMRQVQAARLTKKKRFA